jgi:hypothetical protein
VGGDEDEDGEGDGDRGNDQVLYWGSSARREQLAYLTRWRGFCP